MYVLIATPRYVIGHDTEKMTIEILESGRGSYYGITWSPTGADLVLSHTGFEDLALVDPSIYTSYARGYLTIGEQETWPFLYSPHQILWVKDTIVATNTGRDALATMNPSNRSIAQYRYSSVAWDRLTPTSHDGSHLNALFYSNGKLYVGAHNFDKGSYVLELEWPSLKEIKRIGVQGASGIHNIWLEEGGRLITCHSRNGALIDVESGEVLWSNRRQGFARGLAATEDVILVGHSENSARKNRSFSETGIWFVERSSFRTVDYHCLGHLGAVQEVRVADVPDLCHHGQPLPVKALEVSRNRMRKISSYRLKVAHAVERGDRRYQVMIGPQPAVMPIRQNTHGE
jgi:hypothetical protein